MIRNDRLARAFVELADTLVDDFDVTDFMHVLTDVTVELLAAQGAGLMLADQRGALQMAASTGEVDQLEQQELQLGEGPCLDCFTTGAPVVNTPPAVALQRWPRFTLLARTAGYSAVHSLPMRLRQQTIGAINIYCAEPRPLDDTEVEVAQALADVATIGLLQERIITDKTLLTEQLQGALTTRILIEQAKGVLAERATLTVPQAFTVMRRFARTEELPLRAVAAGIVDGSVDTSSWSAQLT